MLISYNSSVDRSMGWVGQLSLQKGGRAARLERVTFRTKGGEGGEGIIQIYIRKLKVMPVVSCLVSVCDYWFRSPSLSLLRSSLLMVGSLTAGHHLQVAHALVSDEYCTSLDEKDDLNIGAMKVQCIPSLHLVRRLVAFPFSKRGRLFPALAFMRILRRISKRAPCFVNLNVYFCAKVHQLEVKHS